MIIATYKGEQTTICVHDDYCKDIKADAIPTILKQISVIISASVAKNHLYSEEQTQSG